MSTTPSVQSQRKKWLRFLLWGSAIALFFGVWWQIPWAEVVVVLRGLSPTKLLLLAGLDVVIVLTMNGRWWFVLRGMGQRLGYLRLSQYRLVAMSISYFTPGPQFGGEPFQVWVLTKHHDVPTSTAIAAVTVDKLLELVVNFMVLVWGVGVVVQTAVFPTLSSQWTLTLALALWSLPLLLLLALMQKRTPLSTAVAWLSQRQQIQKLIQPRQNSFQQWQIIISESEQQVGQLYEQSPRHLIWALLVTVLNWALWMLEFWFMYALLGLQLSFTELLILVTAVRIAVLLPLPGGLGTMEASQLLAITAIGHPAAIGLSLTLLIHVRDVLIASIGLWLSGRFMHRA